ncbi:hypothetical protein LOC67_25195 [Stieleria sp. JC731]|uniref:hypothetical protein n=1 Tax=Pirellulaceae TaxID=2691357 RepID=UPI001E303476|nr:hypothetical protein [Stieleria sp. JC731]MCC9603861.1 hypothetical protein [Stieleria sp. JC731]
MNEPVNPYAAPIADGDSDSQPSPGDYIVERLEFEGVLTLRDYQDAIISSGLRKDTRRLFRIVVFIAAMSTLVTLLSLFRANSLSDPGFLRSLLAQFVLLSGFIFHLLFHHWQLREVLAKCQSAVGPIKGYIDSSSFTIQSEHSTERHPLEHLVASSCKNDQWSFTFTKTYAFFYVLPFEFFSNERDARHIADHWQQLRPPGMNSVVDLAQQEMPNLDFIRQPAADAVHYEGPVYKGDESGTAFSAAAKSFFRRTMLSVSVMGLGFLGSLAILNSGLGGYLGWGLLYLAVAVLFGFLRIWKERRKASNSEGEVYWQSRGYLDNDGFETMTATGQRCGTWDSYRRYEINDAVIVLYPTDIDIFGGLIARTQFSDDESWHTAIQLIATKLPSNSQYRSNR